MKMIRTLLIGLALLALAAPLPSLAQGVIVVATCGSLTPTQPVGSTQGIMTVDQNGQQCAVPVAAGSITAWAGGTLGAMANYGTSPGAVLVPGVNAFITNTPAVNQGTSPWIAAGGGTAGSAASGVLTVQGIASMTKLLVTPDSVALPANQSINTAQVNGVTTQTGTGVAGTGTQRVTLSNTDPCASPDVVKSSAIIGITSATTTALVTVSGSTTVYVCGYDFTISQVITTANTLVFEGGTGSACAAAVAANTGAFGAGGVTVAAPLHITYSPGGTAFKTAASSGLCALTAIGATGSFQGVLTYVQQ